MTESGSPVLPDPREMERRLDRVQARAEELHQSHARHRERLERTRSLLELVPRTEERLGELVQELFGEILEEIELNLTHAVREILGQERVVKSDPRPRGGRLFVEFHIENEGHQEHILSGQGGSVCNILSVGLRLIALSQLDPVRHRPFLVLDEQDCWLKPELVPRFMGLIREIAERLSLQVFVISHHPLDLFSNQARLIHGLTPGPDGAEVAVLRDARGEADAEPTDAERTDAERTDAERTDAERTDAEPEEDDTGASRRN